VFDFRLAYSLQTRHLRDCKTEHTGERKTATIRARRPEEASASILRACGYFCYLRRRVFEPGSIAWTLSGPNGQGFTELATGDGLHLHIEAGMWDGKVLPSGSVDIAAKGPLMGISENNESRRQ